MRTVILGFEKLPACSLGCYGNWAIPTPEFDAIASRSLLLEHYLLTGESGTDFFTGLQEQFPNSVAVLTPEAGQRPEDMAALLKQRLADVPMVCVHATPTTASMESPSPDELNLAAERVAQLLVTQPAPEVEISAEPQPNALPRTHIGINDLPEWQRPFAAHLADVTVLDHLLGDWLESLEQVLSSGDLLILMGLSGDPRRLPTGRIASSQPEWMKLVSPALTHLPVLLHYVEQDRSGRVPAYFSTSELIQFLQNPDHSPTGKSSLQGEWNLQQGATLHSLWTQDWQVVRHQNAQANPTEFDSGQDGPEVKLFRKPEDYWNLFDLSSQVPDLIQEYLQTGSLNNIH
jgi:hypothetical protein